MTTIDRGPTRAGGPGDLHTDHVDDAPRPEVIVVDGVSKRFTVRRDNSLKERIVTLGRAGRQHREDFWALRDVTVSIAAGTTVGLIGQNGSGKSTLLKAIGGIIQPTSGTVSRRGRLAALLELGAGFHPDLTGRENVFLNASLLGLSRTETESRFDEILAFSGIGDFIDSQVKFYSSGMYVRLAFAVAVHTDPDVLLVDEVLAVGDEAFQRKCIERIRRFQTEGRTIIIVTHSLEQMQEMCDRAVLLNRGQVVFDGNPVDAVGAFRDILDERTAGEHANDPDEGAAHVLRASIQAVGREPGEQIAPGDDLVVEIEFQHDNGIAGWDAAIAITSASGQMVYGTTADAMGVKLAPLHGRRTVRFLIEDVHFGNGRFVMNSSMIDANGRHVSVLDDAGSFDVVRDARSNGTLAAAPSFIGEVLPGDVVFEPVR